MVRADNHVMKFLTFVDVHQQKEVLQQLLQRARQDDIDFVVCAGDFSTFGRGLRNVLESFSSLGKPFYVIPGNHEEHLPEWDQLVSSFPQVISLHHRAVPIGKYLFLGYGGNGFHQEDAEFRKMARQWYGHYKGKKIVLVTHAPPFATTLDLLGERHVGQKDYRKFIERIQPKIAICGHLHETAGQQDHIGKTICIHPGWEGMIVELP